MLARAIDDAPVCVFVADSEMRYRAVNAYACELLGYSEEELLTMHVPDVAKYADAPREYGTMLSSGYQSGVSRIRCKDGEELVLRYVAGAVDFENERLYISIGQVDFDPIA